MLLYKKLLLMTFGTTNLFVQRKSHSGKGINI